MTNALLAKQSLVRTEVSGKAPFPGVHNLVSLFLMLLVAFGAHIEFSWMGFSPTDEGWILAYSRRILSGQVPHRDYIRVQVPGTEFFHAPEVLFGGEYTFWISRLVAWMQIAVIAWAWPIIISKLTRRDLLWPRKDILSLICFAFTACTFPVIIWPTYDGIFFISIGLLLVLRCGSFSKLCGYFLIGLAYMCKQNFVVVFPVFLLILGDWKKIRYWLAASLPGALYVGSMWAFGAIPDVVTQVGSATTFVQRAILPVFTQQNVLLPMGLGLVFISIDLIICRKFGYSAIGYVSVFGVVALLGLALDTDLYWYSIYCSWAMFGFSMGAVLARLLFGQRDNSVVAGLLALAVSWASAISNGFNYPTLGCGVLAVFLLQSTSEETDNSTDRIYPLGASIALMTFVLAGFYLGRHQHIYRDLPAERLTARLDGVLPGGRLLRTNPNTYAFLCDLNEAIRQTHGARFAIVPGFPAYWVKGQELNPLPMDWPYVEVVSTTKMTDRLVKSVADQKGEIILLVEKVEPTDLKSGFKPLDEPIYPAAFLSYVRTHFDKVGETRYFELRK